MQFHSIIEDSLVLRSFSFASAAQILPTVFFFLYKTESCNLILCHSNSAERFFFLSHLSLSFPFIALHANPHECGHAGRCVYSLLVNSSESRALASPLSGWLADPASHLSDQYSAAAVIKFQWVHLQCKEKGNTHAFWDLTGFWALFIVRTKLNVTVHVR